jgi:nicotinate-nucleotide adenylyltransferase
MISDFNEVLKKFDLTHEIVFFGGSFNPWHEGHQACINLLPKEKQLLVILDRNPHKELTTLNPNSKYAELVKKIHLHDELAHREIYGGFLLNQTSNPTINWVRDFKNTYPATPASLLIGFDQLKNFHQWTRIQELAPLLHKVYVASRLENEEEFKTVQHDLVQTLPLKIIPLGHHQYEDLSSTKLRDN